MKRETYINGNKTIIDTDFYLELLTKEQENNKYKKIIKTLKKYSQMDDTYCGNDDYINGKNEGIKEVQDYIASVLREVE